MNCIVYWEWWKIGYAEPINQIESIKKKKMFILYWPAPKPGLGGCPLIRPLVSMAR